MEEIQQTHYTKFFIIVNNGYFKNYLTTISYEEYHEEYRNNGEVSGGNINFYREIVKTILKMRTIKTNGEKEMVLYMRYNMCSNQNRIIIQLMLAVSWTIYM